MHLIVEVSSIGANEIAGTFNVIVVVIFILSTAVVISLVYILKMELPKEWIDSLFNSYNKHIVNETDNLFKGSNKDRNTADIDKNSSDQLLKSEMGVINTNV